MVSPANISPAPVAFGVSVFFPTGVVEIATRLDHPFAFGAGDAARNTASTALAVSVSRNPNCASHATRSLASGSLPTPVRIRVAKRLTSLSRVNCLLSSSVAAMSSGTRPADTLRVIFSSNVMARLNIPARSSSANSGLVGVVGGGFVWEGTVPDLDVPNKLPGNPLFFTAGVLDASAPASPRGFLPPNIPPRPPPENMFRTRALRGPSCGLGSGGERQLTTI